MPPRMGCSMCCVNMCVNDCECPFKANVDDCEFPSKSMSVYVCVI